MPAGARAAPRPGAIAHGSPGARRRESSSPGCGSAEASCRRPARTAAEAGVRIVPLWIGGRAALRHPDRGGSSLTARPAPSCWSRTTTRLRTDRRAPPARPRLRGRRGRLGRGGRGRLRARHAGPASCCSISTCPATPAGSSCAGRRSAPPATRRSIIASATTVSPKRLAEFGCAGYLPKPFALDTLVATVERLLNTGEETGRRMTDLHILLIVAAVPWRRCGATSSCATGCADDPRRCWPA